MQILSKALHCASRSAVCGKAENEGHNAHEILFQVAESTWISYYTI